IFGSGAGSEPTGLANQSGVGTVSFGGAATLPKLIEFEASLANSNAILPDSRLAYLTSPSVRSKLKTQPKIASSTFPIFCWEAGDFADSSDDGMVNSYRAAVTNQLADTDKVIFGDWKALILAIWGNPDLIVNPFSRDTDAAVRLTIHTFADCAVRHP